MLKPFYSNETDIPENLKGAYLAKNGRYELDELDKEHPVIAKNKELLSKNSTLTTDNQRLNSEVTGLESKSLPEGKVAVDPDIEKLGNAAKAAGLKQTEIAGLKTEADTLKSTLAEREKADKQGAIADAMGWKRKEFNQYVKDLDITETEEEKDGKKIKSFYVLTKDTEGKEIKTALAEHPVVKPLLPILALSPEQKKEGFQFSEQGGKEGAAHSIESEEKAAIASGIYAL